MLAPANYIDGVAMDALMATFPGKSLVVPQYTEPENVESTIDNMMNVMITMKTGNTELSIGKGDIRASNSFNSHTNVLTCKFNMSNDSNVVTTGNNGGSVLEADYLISHIRMAKKTYKLVTLQDNNSKTLTDIMFLLANAPDADSQLYLNSKVNLSTLTGSPVKTIDDVNSIFHGTIYAIDIKSYGLNSALNKVISNTCSGVATDTLMLVDTLTREIGFDKSKLTNGLFVPSVTMGYGELIDKNDRFPIENLSLAQVMAMTKDSNVRMMFENGDFIHHMKFLTAVGVQNVVLGTLNRVILNNEFRVELQRAFSTSGYRYTSTSSGTASSFYENMDMSAVISSGSNGMNNSATFIMR